MCSECHAELTRRPTARGILAAAAAVVPAARPIAAPASSSRYAPPRRRAPTAVGAPPNDRRGRRGRGVRGRDIRGLLGRRITPLYRSRGLWNEVDPQRDALERVRPAQ